MKAALFGTKVPTAELGTELVIKCGHKHLVNFEKKTVLMAFSDPPSTLDCTFSLSFSLESLKEKAEKSPH